MFVYKLSRDCSRSGAGRAIGTDRDEMTGVAGLSFQMRSVKVSFFPVSRRCMSNREVSARNPAAILNKAKFRSKYS